MTRAPGRLGAMGKLHAWDEYVTINAQAPSFTAFDRWVADNMDAASRLSPEWEAHYRRGRTHAFVYPLGDKGPLLAGALTPSRDRAGRNYPLFAAREVDAGAIASLETLPLALEETWDEASQMVTRAAHAGTVSALGELVGDASRAEPIASPGALEDWVGWTHSMPLDELAELLFDAADVTPLAVAIRALLDAAAPHRGVIPPRTRLSLRLPLGKAGGAAVCFWLAVAARALRWAEVVPAFFWTHDGGSGSLLLHFGVPPRGTLAQLWMPAKVDDVLDLLDPAAEAHRTEHRVASVETVLATEAASVLELLSAL